MKVLQVLCAGHRSNALDKNYEVMVLILGTILHVKVILQDIVGAAPERQRLSRRLFQPEQQREQQQKAQAEIEEILDDSRSLADYGIGEKGSVLHLWLEQEGEKTPQSV